MREGILFGGRGEMEGLFKLLFFFLLCPGRVFGVLFGAYVSYFCGTVETYFTRRWQSYYITAVGRAFSGFSNLFPSTLSPHPRVRRPPPPHPANPFRSVVGGPSGDISDEFRLVMFFPPMLHWYGQIA